jgi:hypothetical protein
MKAMTKKEKIRKLAEESLFGKIYEAEESEKCSCGEAIKYVTKCYDLDEIRDIFEGDENLVMSLTERIGELCESIFDLLEQDEEK